jgi:hypothetical protein
VITLYYFGRPIRDVETEYGCFGAVSPVPSMARHALSVNEAVHPALLESTRESSIKLNADKRIYVVADWTTKPESFQRRRNAGRLGTTSNRATYQTDVDANSVIPAGTRGAWLLGSGEKPKE